MTDGVSETTFAYDKRGNITQKTTGNKVSTFRYNAANRLVSATNSDGLSSRYAYNGLGFRVSKTSGNSSIDYILDQTMMYNNLLEEVSNNQSNDYIWHEDTLISKSNIPIYSDRLNTPIRIGDKAYSYDEFGVSLHGVDGMGFIGYMHDDISGTYFAQAREYLPEIGRFAGRDILKGEVEIPRSLNEYVYCHNNPIGLVDYDGMKATAASNSNTKKIDELLKKVTVSFATDKAGEKLESMAKKPLKKWEQKALKKIDKAYDTQIRTHTNRILNNRRPGRVAKAGKELVKTEIKKTSDMAKVVSKSKAATKLAKAGPGAIAAAAGVALDYRKDTKAGLTKSKRRTNFIVNASFATAGIAATVLIASGPIGVAVGIGLVGFEIIASDYIKNKWNSLD